MRLTRPADRLAIPKILHHTWVGDDPLSEAALEMIAKWRRHHPGPLPETPRPAETAVPEKENKINLSLS